MSSFLLTIFLLLVFLIFSGLKVCKRYKSLSGVFYGIFTICVSIWLILLVLSYDLALGKEYITYIFKAQYALGIIALYSIICFVYFYGIHFQRRLFTYICVFFITLIGVTVGTDGLVKDLVLHDESGIYIEEFGVFYPVYMFIYALIFPLFLYVSFLKIRRSSLLEKVRLTYIVIGFIIFISLALSVHVFLPFFTGSTDLLISKKITPLSLLPFIGTVLYVSYKYDFSSVRIRLYFLLRYLISFLVSVCILFVINNIFRLFNPDYLSYLDVHSGRLTWPDVFLAISIYGAVYSLLKNKFSYNRFQDDIFSLQDEITHINSKKTLERFLKKSFRKKLGIENVQIIEKSSKNSVIFGFLERHKYFLNDWVFIESHKGDLDLETLSKQVLPNQILFFPIYTSQESVHLLLVLGQKKFSRAYTYQEIRVFRKFSHFLSRHLKYMSVYNKLSDLSLQLDKRVDEKTLEYNSMITRQKEFIRYLAHEVRNPITTIMFLFEDLESELRAGSCYSDNVKVLKGELENLMMIVKNLFNVEQFDLGKISCSKLNINVENFLKDVMGNFKALYPKVDFTVDIESELGRKEIDKTQFIQLLRNLIQNAVKFSNPSDKKIIFKAQKLGDFVQIIIEDNGKGFSLNEMGQIFEKYSTGESVGVGIGLGLYLCKRIVELHGGKITASNGMQLGGARFVIEL